MEPNFADEIRVQEIKRDGAQRVYAVQVPSSLVAKRTHDQLTALGQSVRLPGFRPGKIPAAVLEQRYGTKAKATVASRMALEAADGLMRQGGFASKVEVVSDGNADDLEFRIEVTHLPDLPPIDFSSLELERLTVPENNVRLSEIIEDRLRERILDFLNSAYEFPVAPELVKRQFQAIMNSAGAQLQAVELRQIAERRVRLGAVVAEMARRYEIRLTADELQTEFRIRNRLTESRVMEFLMARARVTGRAASEDELRELLED